MVGERGSARHAQVRRGVGGFGAGEKLVVVADEVEVGVGGRVGVGQAAEVCQFPQVDQTVAIIVDKSRPTQRVDDDLAGSDRDHLDDNVAGLVDPGEGRGGGRSVVGVVHAADALIVHIHLERARSGPGEVFHVAHGKLSDPAGNRFGNQVAGADDRVAETEGLVIDEVFRIGPGRAAVIPGDGAIAEVTSVGVHIGRRVQVAEGFQAAAGDGEHGDGDGFGNRAIIVGGKKPRGVNAGRRGVRPGEGAGGVGGAEDRAGGGIADGQGHRVAIGADGGDSEREGVADGDGFRADRSEHRWGLRRTAIDEQGDVVDVCPVAVGGAGGFAQPDAHVARGVDVGLIEGQVGGGDGDRTGVDPRNRGIGAVVEGDGAVGVAGVTRVVKTHRVHAGDIAVHRHHGIGAAQPRRAHAELAVANQCPGKRFAHGPGPARQGDVGVGVKKLGFSAVFEGHDVVGGVADRGGADGEAHGFHIAAVVVGGDKQCGVDTKRLGVGPGKGAEAVGRAKRGPGWQVAGGEHHRIAVRCVGRGDGENQAVADRHGAVADRGEYRRLIARAAGWQTGGDIQSPAGGE